MTPVRMISNDETNPTRIEDTRQMLEAVASATLARYMIHVEAWTCEGYVYLFLPGMVAVYDHFEFMAELRKEES